MGVAQNYRVAVANRAAKANRVAKSGRAARSSATGFVPWIFTRCEFAVRADLVVLNSTTVSTWTDRSGKSRSPTQASAPLQPLFVSSGQNGRSAVRFDGTGTLLTSASANLFGAGAYTVFAVVKGDAGTFHFFFENSTGTLSNGVLLGNAGSASRSATHSGAVDHVDGAGTTSVEYWVIRRDAAAAPVGCPYCGSFRTTLENVFGPTQCRSIRHCADCRQPFESFKPV